MKLLNLIILCVILFTSCSKDESIKFAVCADVHQDIIHDAPERIKTFVNEAENEKVDFIIQLGDFCFPKEQNAPFLEAWNSFSGPKYHCLGNHDMDVSSKQVAMDYLGMENSYYSFDVGAFHFVVLDPNFFVDGEEFTDYEKSNYFSHKESRATIPQEQVEWLRNDISQTEKLVVVFSHQNLEGLLTGKSGVKNQSEIRRILEEANAKTKKVIACFSGHDHHDVQTEINGIHYVRINSMSYEWVGKEYQCKDRFSKEINDYRPALKNTVPYAKPVFAIVEIDLDGLITISGKEGAYILPGPEELGIQFDYELTPSVSDRILNF